MNKNQKSKLADRPVTYEIVAAGALDRGWQDWLGGLTVTVRGAGTSTPRTVLRGKVADQSALCGILCRIMNLNLQLISLRQLDEKGGIRRKAQGRLAAMPHTGGARKTTRSL